MVPKKYLGVFVLLVSCFALWGLLNDMTTTLVPAFQKIFTIPQSKSALVQVAFYGAYAVLAIFASVLAEEFSYRRGVLIGLFIYITGALLYIPACIAQSFDIYFIAIFVVASGCALLETTCNPYVLSLGDKETAVFRLNFAQMFNPVGALCGVVLAQQLILSNLNPATADERAAMKVADPEKLKAIVNSELFWVCAPYVALCAIAAILWFCFLRANDDAAGKKEGGMKRVVTAFLFALVPLAALYPAIPFFNSVVPGKGEVIWIICGICGPIAYTVVMPTYRAMLKILLSTPRYWCGVITQFFYVGVQIAAWTLMISYACQELGVSRGQAGIYFIIAVVFFTVFRWLATFAMRFVAPWLLMAIFALGAVLTSFGCIYLPSNVVFTVGNLPFSWNVIMIPVMTGFMSLMFPTIYGIALGGLDPKAYKLGASGLIMAILGGAIITPWMAGIMGAKSGFFLDLVPMFSDAWNSDLMLSSRSARASFFVPVICFTVVFIYALVFRGKGSESK